MVRPRARPKVVRAGADPCLPLKAIKNAAEIRGARAAHVRDGAALARYLAWLDREGADRNGSTRSPPCASSRTIRAGTQALKEISFDTISGAAAPTAPSSTTA